MPGFNRVMLMGNLTRDPQVKHLPRSTGSGQANQTVVADFGLACNRRYRTADGDDREETTFVDCTAFGRQAEVIAEWCTKGKPIFLEGRLKYDTWDDKNGGGKRSKLSVVVESFQFIGSRDDGGQRGNRAQPGQTPDRATQGTQGDDLNDAERPNKRPTPAGAGFRQSDIPF